MAIPLRVCRDVISTVQARRLRLSTYFQGADPFFYDAFHSTGESNGVECVPGLGERAFIYVGGDGPGLVEAKGDKVFQSSSVASVTDPRKRAVC